jgi:hypothetical protein
MTSRISIVTLLICLMGISLPALSQASTTKMLPYAIQHHDLSLSLDPSTNYLRATDQMMIRPALPGALRWHFYRLELLLRRGLNVTGVWLNNEQVEFSQGGIARPSHFEGVSDSESSGYYDLAQVISVEVPWKTDRRGFSLKLAYEGVVKDSLEGADFSREYVTEQITGIIDTIGIYLGSEGIFYPALPNQLFTFTLNVTVPEGLRTMSEGSLKGNDVANGLRTERWVNTYPMDAFQVIAGQFKVNNLDHAGVAISTYFFPDPKDSAESLSQKYLQMSAGYVDLYDSLLGKYPFEKFSVVENFFATGYGMPSFTLLGSEVLRLPFIPYTSLGHEVCHNWWGNSVYVDYLSGNWCEGLTTYCADYLYKESKSLADAREYRMGINQDYTAYTHKANDFPLTDFRVRHNPAQRAVGYGKSAMVYHMLRRQIGEDAFWKGLQRFNRDNAFKFASWTGVRQAFERETVSDLAGFFDQWVKRTGAPELAVKSAGIIEVGNRWQVNFILEQMQKEPPYTMNVPVRIKGESQDTTFLIPMQGNVHSITINTGFKPVSITVDPDFDVFRRLDPMEISPSLAQVLGASELIIILPTGAITDMQKAYTDLAGQLNREGRYRLVKDNELTPEDLQGKALFILGTPSENPGLPQAWSQDDRWTMKANEYTLLNAQHSDPHAAMLVVTRHPQAQDLSVAWFSAHTPEDVMETGRKLTHYGKYSYLVFVSGKNQVKGSWEITTSPLIVKF